MEIKTVAILGAGAVGAYFITGLREKLGDRLTVICDGERRRKLTEQGLWVNGERVEMNLRSAEETGPVDLVLVAVKYGALRGCLPDIQTLTGPDTMVMSLMNGVDSEEIIGEKIGMQHMLYAYMKIASQRVGQSIVYNAGNTMGLYFGEKNAAEPTERALAVEALLTGSGVRFHYCSDVMHDMWMKYASNISSNLPQAVIGCGIGGERYNEHVKWMHEAMREEVMQVAEAKGIDLRSGDQSALSLAHVRDDAKFSTLQDLEAGRHTEIDMFSGALVRMGRELSVLTPYNEMVYHIIKALEEKNDGKLDY